MRTGLPEGAEVAAAGAWVGAGGCVGAGAAGVAWAQAASATVANTKSRKNETYRNFGMEVSFPLDTHTGSRELPEVPAGYSRVEAPAFALAGSFHLGSPYPGTKLFCLWLLPPFCMEAPAGSSARHVKG